MSESTIDTIIIFCAFVVVTLILLNFGGCQYKEYWLEKQKLEAQAAGKLLPDNVHVYRLDEEQFNRLVEAIRGVGDGNKE